MSQPADKSRPALWITLAAFCFAIMGAFAHALGPRCDWLTIAFVRAGFMFLSSLTLAWATGTRLVVWRPRTLWMRSLAGSLSLCCSFYALTRLPLGDVLTLTNTYPLWIVVLGWLTFRSRPDMGDGLRVVCGLAGVVLIERPDLSGDHLAAGVALTASGFSAVAMIGLHRLRGVDSKAVVAHFAGVASLFIGSWIVARALGFVGDGAHYGPTGNAFNRETAMMLLGLAISGTIGQVFLTRAYASGAPARVSVLALTQVVFGLGFDVLFWNRSLPLSSLAGTALVLAPSAWIVSRTGMTDRKRKTATEESEN